MLQIRISISDRTESRLAVKKILELRGEGEMGGITVTLIREKVKALQELLDWDVYNEPDLALNLSTTNIKELSIYIMEQAVKETTRAV